MLAIAAVVPETALLVPGAAGRAVVLEDLRAAAVAAVRDVVRSFPDHVVVVAPGPVDLILDGPVYPSLAAAGIDDGGLGWALPDDVPPPAGTEVGGPVPGVGASVALLLLAAGGWTGSTTVVEVAPPAPDSVVAGQRGVDGERAGALRALGAGLVGRSGRVALVVAGSLSARNGPHAPHPADDRAGPLDAAILDDLSCGDPLARLRLAAIAGTLAAKLVVTVWAPLQVLLGAAAGVPSLKAAAAHAGAPYGVTYAVATWRASSAPVDAGPHGSGVAR